MLLQVHLTINNLLYETLKNFGKFTKTQYENGFNWSSHSSLFSIKLLDNVHGHRKEKIGVNVSTTNTTLIK